jgi:hypothetical protein
MEAANSASANSTAATDLQSIVDAPAYDEPYRFGRTPTTRAPFPFTERQFLRLLIVRGRLYDHSSALDQAA